MTESRGGFAEPAPLGDSVDQADTPTVELLNLPEFESTTAFRRCKERVPFTGDERVNNEPELMATAIFVGTW